MSYVIVPDIMYFKLNEFSDLTLNFKSLDEAKTYATYNVHKSYLARLSPTFYNALRDNYINELDVVIPEAYLPNHQEIIEFLYSPGEKKVSTTTKELMQTYYPLLEFTDGQLEQIQDIEDKHLEMLNTKREADLWRERAMQQASPLLSVQGSSPRALPSFSDMP